MEWLQMVLSVLLGGVIGGGASWHVMRMEWRRNRRSDALEEFYRIAWEVLTAVDPLGEPGTLPTGVSDRMHHAYVVLNLYAPKAVREKAEHFMAEVFESEWDGPTTDQHERFRGLLETYEDALRHCLGLPSRQPKGSTSP